MIYFIRYIHSSPARYPVLLKTYAAPSLAGYLTQRLLVPLILQ
jgi:hypothetical protein